MIRWIAAFVCVLLMANVAYAGLEHLAGSHGMLPGDIALAGATADGVPGPAAAYHNPAAMADLEHTTLSYGYSYFSSARPGNFIDKSPGFHPFIAQSINFTILTYTKLAVFSSSIKLRRNNE